MLIQEGRHAVALHGCPYPIRLKPHRFDLGVRFQGAGVNSGTWKTCQHENVFRLAQWSWSKSAVPSLSNTKNLELMPHHSASYMLHVLSCLALKLNLSDQSHSGRAVIKSCFFQKCVFLSDMLHLNSVSHNISNNQESWRSSH